MKKFIHIYIRFIQKILITVLLTVLYFIVFSITKLLVNIFPNKPIRKLKNSDSYWRIADDYSASKSAALEQS